MAAIILRPSDRRLIKWSAHLRRAGGGDEAIILVKVQAAVVPGKAEKLKEPTALTCEVGDQLFILDFKDRQIDHRFPMYHDPLILAVIVAQPAQIAGIFVCQREVGHETGETGVHRVAPAMDDARLGQQQGDQPEVKEIGGHFIGDSQGGGVERFEWLQILMRQFVNAIGRQRAQSSPKPSGLAEVVPPHLKEAGQLTGAMN